MLASRPEIVGRGAELAQVDAFLQEAQPPAVLVIEGDAGIGKTTIWAEAVARAEERGLRILAASPAQAESKLSFSGLADLLEGALEEVVGELPEPQGNALQIALLRTESEAVADPRAGAFAFLGALRSLAAHAPLALAVDDVQWLDPPSAEAVSFAVRRLRTERIVLLIARRLEGTEVGLPLALDRAPASVSVSSLRLGPLSLGAIHRLLRDRLGSSLPRPALRRLHEASGGNPFFAIELARAVAGRLDDIRPGRPLPVPTTMTDLLHQRIATLPGRTRDVLLAASALAEPTVEALGASGVKDLDDALRPALKDGLVEFHAGSVRFTHPLLASAVYEAATPQRRRALHRTLAAAARSAEERARHLAYAQEEPDADVAGTLERAADEARTRGATAAAAELLEQARRLTPVEEAEARSRRTAAAAEAISAAGDLVRARQLFREAIADAPSGPPRARVLALASWQHLVDRMALLDEALVQAGDDPRIRAEIHLSRSWGLIFESFAAALPDALQAMELAEVSSEAVLQARALNQLGFLEMVLAEPTAAETLERASALADRIGGFTGYETPGTNLGHLHMFHERFDEARAAYEAQAARAGSAGDEDSKIGIIGHLSELEWRVGRWVLAEGYTQEGVDFDEESAEERPHGAALWFRGLVAAHRGRLEAARADAELALARSLDLRDGIWEIHSLGLLGFVALSADAPVEALAHLETLPALTEKLAAREPGIFHFHGDLIEALVRTGALESAELEARKLEGRARKLGRRWALVLALRGRALVAAERGDLEGALALLEEARETSTKLAMPFERARTLLTLGAVNRRAKKKRAAREALSEALTIFEELGAPVWARKAQAESDRIGGRPAASGELTETEQRVAALVAQGRSNKEVARELFVTVKTVERNLSQIYRKVGVRSRAELAHHLSSREGAEPETP
jgi:DNA-binding CsgD family transcriptional regulator